MAKDLSFPGYVHFNYPRGRRKVIRPRTISRTSRSKAGRYAPGNVSYVAYAGQYEALKRILALGVNNIYAYTKPMCDRLKKELPALGCQLITPMDAVRSIVVVQAKNLKTTEEKLRKSHVQVTTTGANRVRISPALYNNMEDINRLLSALRDAPIA